MSENEKRLRALFRDVRSLGVPVPSKDVNALLDVVLAEHRAEVEALTSEAMAHNAAATQYEKDIRELKARCEMVERRWAEASAERSALRTEVARARAEALDAVARVAEYRAPLARRVYAGTDKALMGEGAEAALATLAADIRADIAMSAPISTGEAARIRAEALEEAARAEEVRGMTSVARRIREMVGGPAYCDDHGTTRDVCGREHATPAPATIPVETVREVLTALMPRGVSPSFVEPRSFVETIAHRLGIPLDAGAEAASSSKCFGCDGPARGPHRFSCAVGGKRQVVLGAHALPATCARCPHPPHEGYLCGAEVEQQGEHGACPCGVAEQPRPPSGCAELCDFEDCRKAGECRG